MGHYFTEYERYQLEGYYNDLKMQPKEIAVVMHKHINTIYNELKRGRVKMLDSNLCYYYKYCADYAQNDYEYKSTAKGRQLKISSDYDFVEFIEDKVINGKYSLYSALILSRGMFKTYVCLRTLYNYVYNNVFLNLTKKNLFRKKHIKEKQPKKIYALGKRLIDERDKSVNLRSDFGHWEMDTIVSGKGCKSCLLVLTERKTRYELIYKIPDKKSATVWSRIECVADVLQGTFKNVFKSLTCDNGVEFCTNYSFKNMDLLSLVKNRLYYCHAYRSNERGSNENQNRMIRKHVVKGSHISEFSDDYILNVRNWLNGMPRKLFNGLSSSELVKREGVYDELCRI